MPPSRWPLMVLLALALPAAGAPRAQAQAPATRTYPDPAQAPAQRTVELELTASPARVVLRPGTTTSAYAYNGTVPGPTIDLREGDRVIVNFRNALPEATTVHWHGLHLPFEADGSPFHPVAPGETYRYEFTVRPGSAGTYWYHPHPHHATGWQVTKGLYGAIVVRAADDPLAGIPEQLVMLSDNRLRDDGEVDLPEEASLQARADFENGREGDAILVNGQIRPVIAIAPGEVQRWRIINASAARVYRLAFPGKRIVQVGSDGGLLEQPVELDELVLAAAERVELLVHGSGRPGTSTVLQALPYDRYVPQTRPADWNVTRELLELRYTAPATEAPASRAADSPSRPDAEPPAVLRSIPPLDTLAATATHVITLSQGMINGRLMDMDRVDVRAKLGATEIWQIENLVGMDHPFHLHGFQFQVIDRDGVAEPFRSWKDVVNVRRHEVVRIIARYDDYPGKWMFHCHILDHEDHGMMGVLQVD